MTPHVPIDEPRPSPGGRSAASYFASKGAFVRDPRGGSGGKGPIEDAAGLKAAGFRWVVFNVGDHPDEAAWKIWAHACIDNRLDYGPWARCHTAADVEALVRAFPEGDLIVCNMEQESSSPRWQLDAVWVAEQLAETLTPVAVSTEPWLPNNFAWDELEARGISCLPQAFTDQQPDYIPHIVCARARGWFTRVYPTCGAYPGSLSPDLYRRSVGVGRPFSVYAVDDVPAWRAWNW